MEVELMVLRRFGAEPFIVSIERSRRRCSSHLHEKNSGRVEKRCFAGNPILVLLERSVADMVRAARTGVTPHANRAGGTIESKGGPIDERRQISRDATTFCGTVPPSWSGQRAPPGLREPAQEPRLLSDIGLSREQVRREAHKPFWRR
jgi:hypothetical protein